MAPSGLCLFGPDYLYEAMRDKKNHSGFFKSYTCLKFCVSEVVNSAKLKLLTFLEISTIEAESPE